MTDVVGAGGPPRAVGSLPPEDIALLRPGTAWHVAWELLMLAPLTGCALHDGDDVRHVTAGAMVRSAVRRSSGPEHPLHPPDFVRVPVFAPDMTLIEAARLVVDTGWELAAVQHAEPRLITPRSVFRSLLLGTPAHGNGRGSAPG